MTKTTTPSIVDPTQKTFLVRFENTEINISAQDGTFLPINIMYRAYTSEEAVAKAKLPPIPISSYHAVSAREYSGPVGTQPGDMDPKPGESP